MDRPHNLAPNGDLEGPLQRAILGVPVEIPVYILVKTCPDSGDVVRRIAGEYLVVHLGGGPCFSRDIHACAKPCRCSGSTVGALHHVAHHIGQQPGGGGFNDRVTFRYIFQDEVALAVLHPGVQNRFDVYASVGNGPVGGGQL